MNHATPRILIIIPAFRAASFLAELIGRIEEAAPDADILVINDGSPDDTTEILEKLNVNHLVNDRNRGKGYALRRGFDFAVAENYDYALTIDADLQHRPEEIRRFTESPFLCDIMIGTRRMDARQMPFNRRLVNNLTSLIVSIFSGRRIRDSQSGYRMISTGVIKRLHPKSRRYDYETEMLFQAGLLDVAIAEVPVSTVYGRQASYINPLCDTGRFIRQIWRRLFL